MKKSYFLLIGFFLNSAVLANDFQHPELIGFWGDAFPVSTAENGYYFLKDNVYFYISFHKEDVQKQYYGSSGTWEIDNSGGIIIHKDTEYYWKELIPSDGGVDQFPMDESAIFCKNISAARLHIGNINKYVEFDGTYPPKMILKNDSCSKSLMYWKTKSVVNKQELQDIVEKRLQMKCFSE